MKIDAWKLYCEAFRALFPSSSVKPDGDIVSPAALQEMVERLVACRPEALIPTSRGPYKVGEPEDDDGSLTVLNSSGESMTADEIVALLNTYSRLAVGDFSTLSPQREPSGG